MPAFTKSNSGSLVAGLILCALLIFIFACHVFPITDTDIWWHLSAARWMLQHRAIPHVDPFCTASRGAPWIDAQWGFQVIVYALWKLGGDTALVAAKAAAAAGIFFLVLKRAWNLKTAPFLAALGAYAAFHGRYLTDVRPLWVTLLLLALQYRWLRDAWDDKRRLPWVRLTVSQLAMAQMQGLFWLGPIQAAVLCLGEEWNAVAKIPSASQRWNALLNSMRLPAVLFFAGLVNPNGWRGWIFPLRLLHRIVPGGGAFFSHQVAENIPFWEWLPQNPAAAYPFLLLAAAAVGPLIWNRCRQAWGEAFLLAVYGGLGLMAQRNLPLFLLAVLIVVARVLQTIPIQNRVAGRGKYRILTCFAWAWTVLHVALFAADLRLEKKWEIPGSWETPFRFPEGAVAYLNQRPFLQGVLFNEIRHGGYLDWKLTTLHAFVDGRMILHDADFWRKFLNLFDHPEQFAEYRNRYHIGLVLLPIGEDARYLPLAAYLARTHAMTILYCDGADVLLAADSCWKKDGVSPLKAWSPADGRTEALRRFGKNPRLLLHALNRLDAWEQAVESTPAATGFSRAALKLFPKKTAPENPPRFSFFADDLPSQKYISLL